MQSADTVALTTDGWTSRSTEPYNTITAHYIKDWNLTAKVFQTEKQLGSYTGENLAMELNTALAKWYIERKINGITVDNAANIGKACKLYRGINIKVPCFAHTLNLCTGRTSELTQEFAKFIQQLVSFFHWSHLGGQVFSEVQGRLNLKKHKLIIHVKTRWNSTYIMAEHFLEQHLAVSAAFADPRLAAQKHAKAVKSDLSELQVRTAEEYVALIQYLYEATNIVSSEGVSE